MATIDNKNTNKSNLPEIFEVQWNSDRTEESKELFINCMFLVQFYFLCEYKSYDPTVKIDGDPQRYLVIRSARHAPPPISKCAEIWRKWKDPKYEIEGKLQRLAVPCFLSAHSLPENFFLLHLSRAENLYPLTKNYGGVDKWVEKRRNDLFIQHFRLCLLRENEKDRIKDSVLESFIDEDNVTELFKELQIKP